MNKLVYFIEHHDVLFILLLVAFTFLVWLVFRPKRTDKKMTGLKGEEFVGSDTTEHLLDRMERSQLSNESGERYDKDWRN